MPDGNSTTAIGWVPAWADLQERASEPSAAGFVVGAQDGAEVFVAWPAAEAGAPVPQALEAGSRLTLVIPEGQTAPDFVSELGFAPAEARVLLTAPVAELNTEPELPDNAQVVDAPMESYDVVELSVFGQPVARGRVQVRDGFAAASITELPETSGASQMERALFAVMAEEAFLHGAELLHMVVEQPAVAHYLKSGWSVAGEVVSFTRS